MSGSSRDLSLLIEQGPGSSFGECTPSDVRPKASARAITLNFITGGLGSALFNLPWSVAGASIIPSILLIAFVLLLNGWTISIIVRAGERHNAFNLGDVIGRLPWGLGPPLQLVTNVFVWVTMFLCLVSYVIVIHDSALTYTRGTVFESRLLLVALASLLVLPLCFLSQRLLERTSSVAVAVNVYLFVLVGVLYGRGLSAGTLPHDSCIFGTTVRGAFAMVTVMFQAVIIQMCVLPMYKDLEDRSPEKFDKIVLVGFGTLFVLFCGFSCVGYLLIGPSLDSNILSDLPAGVGSSIAQVGVIFVVACVYPIMLFPMIAPIRDGSGPIYGVRREVVELLAKIVIVVGAMLVACVVKTLGAINTINGALSAMVFIAVVPSVVGLTLLDSSRCHRVALVLLLVGGITLSTLGFVFKSNYVEDLRCLLLA